MRLLRENKAEVGIAIAALAVLAFKSGDIKANLNTSAMLSSISAEQSTQADIERITQEHAESKAAMAEERYKDGCQMILSMNFDNTLTQIVPGQPVVRGEYADAVKGGTELQAQHVLPAGMVVCDAWGNTSWILAGVDGGLPYAGPLVSTQDMSVVNAAIEIAGYRRPTPVN